MDVTWTRLDRKDVSCASASHGEHVPAAWRMDAGDVGSFYCGMCRLMIARDARIRETDRVTSETLAALPPFPEGD